MVKFLKLYKTCVCVWGKPLMLNPCVGSPGNRGAFCPLHQTSVVFMQRWDACWDRQSGPMAFGLGDTKISFKPPPTSRSGLSLCFAQTVKGWHFSALISARALYVPWQIYSFLWMHQLCGDWAQLFLWRYNAHIGLLEMRNDQKDCKMFIRDTLF